MFGVPVVYLLLKILDIFCFLYLLKERSEVSKVIELFSNEIKKISFLLSFVYFVLIMHWSMLKMMCLPFVPKMKLFIRHLALIHPNKMELLNTNINIF